MDFFSSNTCTDFPKSSYIFPPYNDSLKTNKKQTNTVKPIKTFKQ